MLLDKELKIKNVTLQNRIVMPPMATEKSDQGIVTQDQIDYYVKRAQNTGLVIVEHAYVSPEGKCSKNQLSICDDNCIGGLKKLSDAIHATGSVCLTQLAHAGARAKYTGLAAISPSGIKLDEENPVEMTSEDIERIRESFLKAAIRSKEAGFDGVEVHSAHIYLLNQFYSPITNKRTDKYTGATIEGRTKLQCEIIRAIRQEIGEEFIIAIRLGAYDYEEEGSQIEDIPLACQKFVEAGADIIDISGGLHMYNSPESDEPGYFKKLSIAAKSGVNVPVILTGGIKTSSEAEKLLEENAADLIGVGRAMIKNPDWSTEAVQ